MSLPRPLKARYPRGLWDPLALLFTALLPMFTASASAGEMKLIQVATQEFYIDLNEVTVEEFTAFDPSFKPAYEYFKDPRQPATAITFDKARAYCRAQGRRLPTSEEWQLACRGLEGLEYSYGNAYDPNKARIGRRIWTDGPKPVGSFEKNEFGLYDMSGNVWEWADNGEPEGELRAIHGGSWVDGPQKTRCASKRRSKPALAAVNYGLRCARSLTDEDRAQLAEEERQRQKKIQAVIRREQARKQAVIDAKLRAEREKVEAEAKLVLDAETAKRQAREEEATRKAAALAKRVEGMVRVSPNALVAFYIDPHEVTNREYKMFDPAFKPDEFSEDDDYPATGLTFKQASAYCRSREKRLPRPAEWSAACLGSKGLLHSYGHEYDPTQGRTGLGWHAGPVSVGTGQANEYGIKNIVGNVWEWVDGNYGKGRSYRAAYGGGWVDGDQHAKCTEGTWVPEGGSRSDLGFRCIVSTE